MYQTYQIWKTTPITGKIVLSIVIPAYNEAERIVPTIGAIAAHVCTLDIPWELIVADDGSSDDTAEIVESLELANCQLLRAPANGGKGSAVKRGMMAARGEYILFTDADNSTPIQEINKTLQLAQNDGFDMVIGSRAASGAEEQSRSIMRRALSGGLRLLVQTVFRMGVEDTQCGFKLYTRDAARELCEAQTLMGFSFDLEHLYLAHKFGYTLAEVPVQWIDAPGSKVDGLKEAQRFLKDLGRIKLNDWKGRYDTDNTKTSHRNCFHPSTW